jgi:hypothetical protein
MEGIIIFSLNLVRFCLHIKMLCLFAQRVYVFVAIMLWLCLFVFGATAPPPHPQWTRASSFTRTLHHTQRRTTVGRTRLDEWSARPIDLCMTTHTHNRQTSMHSVGFELSLSRWAAADLRPRPLSHWGRLWLWRRDISRLHFGRLTMYSFIDREYSWLHTALLT